MSVEGQVSIVMSLAGQSVSDVSVLSQRPLLAQQLLAGSQADAAPQTVAMVFRLCARAQAAASVSAVEQAKGIVASSHAQTVRQQLVRMEVLREHLWRVLLDWPVLRGLKAESLLMKQMLQLDKEWHACMDVEGKAFVCGAEPAEISKDKAISLLMQLGQLLKEHVFYMPPQSFYDCKRAEDYLLWAQYTQPGVAPFIQWLVLQGWQQSGQTEESILPRLSCDWLNERLNSDEAEQFMAMPELHHKPCETTPYARQQSHSLMIELEKKFGNGLLPRFTAVLLELAAVYLEMTHALLQPVSIQHDAATRIEHVGLGAVEAARGRLIHRVSLAGDKVKTYQIVAPTEWNFHPDGVLKQALLKLQGDVQAIEQQGRLLIHAMDPCVQFSLQVNIPEQAHA